MVSRIFEEVFDTRGGSLVVVCECGRTHFNVADPQDYEGNQLEELEAARKDKPDKYYGWDHSIGTMYVPFAGEVVFDCPCGRAEKVEKILQSQGEGIANYLNRYANSLRSKADRLEVGVYPVGDEAEETEATLVRKSDVQIEMESGEAIRIVRRILGLSLGEASKALNISTSRLSDIERGKSGEDEGYLKNVIAHMVFCASRKAAEDE